MSKNIYQEKLEILYIMFQHAGEDAEVDNGIEAETFYECAEWCKRAIENPESVEDFACAMEWGLF